MHEASIVSTGKKWVERGTSVHPTMKSVWHPLNLSSSNLFSAAATLFVCEFRSSQRLFIR